MTGEGPSQPVKPCLALQGSCVPMGCDLFGGFIPTWSLSQPVALLQEWVGCYERRALSAAGAAKGSLGPASTDVLGWSEPCPRIWVGLGEPQQVPVVILGKGKAAKLRLFPSFCHLTSIQSSAPRKGQHVLIFQNPEHRPHTILTHLP